MYHCRINIKREESRLVYLLPFCCLLCLLMFGWMIVNPLALPFHKTVYAEEDSTQAIDGLAARVATRPSTPVIELSISQPNLRATIDYNTDQGFSTLATGVGVQVKDASLFQLYIESANEDKTDVVLHGGAGNPTIISALESAQTAGDFMDNTWGYNLAAGLNVAHTDETIYSGLPTKRTAITPQLSGDELQTYTLTFAAKISKNAPADTYSGGVILSVVAEPKAVATGLVGLAERNGSMQEMTQNICAESDVHDTARLRDSRDNNYYWVAKLADGNCWMTQNLDLDIAGVTTSGVPANAYSTKGVQITKANGSNVDWTAATTGVEKPATTLAKMNVLLIAGKPNHTNSQDVGQYVINEPINPDSSCGDAVVAMSDCPLFTNVSTMKPYTGEGDFYRATVYSMDGREYAKAVNSTVDKVNGYYDAHYLVGNFYSYNAATAGTGAKVTAQYAIASGDICPKGWQLPLSGVKYNNQSGSFYNLLEKYGLTNYYVGTANNPYPLYDEGNTILTTSPLYYVRAGIITNKNTGWGTGEILNLYSAVSRNETTSTYLSINESAWFYPESLPNDWVEPTGTVQGWLYPSYFGRGGYRYEERPVRCVVLSVAGN